MDKKALNAYGSLMKKVSKGSTPTKKPANNENSSLVANAASSEAYVEPPVETSSLLTGLSSAFNNAVGDVESGEKDGEVRQKSASMQIQAAMISANTAAAFDYLKDQVKSVHDRATSGPQSFRFLSLIGGGAMAAQAAMGSIGKFFSFSPLQACIEAYCFIFGVMIVILEARTLTALSGFRKTLNEYAKFLTFTWGRGIFYFFAGSLMFSCCTLFDMAIGGFMMFLGFTHIVVGNSTANKLTGLKGTLGSEKVVRSMFDKHDADKSGFLNSTELAALCKDLNSPLNHNELVCALDAMDADKNGEITFDEFYGWWAGWKHEVSEEGGMPQVAI